MIHEESSYSSGLSEDDEDEECKSEDMDDMFESHTDGDNQTTIETTVAQFTPKKQARLMN